MLIEFNGWHGKPIFIEKSRIVSASTWEGEKDGSITCLQIAVGKCSEEWKIREPLESVRIKMDNSN